ncbi:DUF1385 domain-containing protein, partial [Mesorhizobium sp. M00.F.Ca.ET.186.01.1.1]
GDSDDQRQQDDPLHNTLGQGVSYEVLQWTNKLRDTPVLRYLGYPGLWLQKITTREPDDSQVEVAIASFQKMRELDLQHVQGKMATTG